MSKDPRTSADNLYEQIGNCPSCGQEVAQKQAECFSCGIVFSSYAKFQFDKQLKEKVGGIDHLSVTNIKALERAWKQVVVNYHDKNEHQNFLQKCFKEKALPYAVHFYSRMLEIDVDDDIAQMMRRQALSMMTTSLSYGESEGVSSEFQKKTPVMKWSIYIGLCLSLICVSAGLFLPNARNLIGLGVSFLAIFGFLYFYRRDNL